MAANPQAFADRLDAIVRLTALFRVERFVYLTITIISFLLLAMVAVRMFIENALHIEELGLFFGSTGLITITANRVLQVWTQAIRMLASEPADGRLKGVDHA
jgi:hypothetical protein